MRSYLIRAAQLGIVAVSLSTQIGRAENEVAAPVTTEETHEQSWYREQNRAKLDARAIIQQKAQAAAQQRQARLASMSWYGMSNSRPTGSPMPFTSRYSPVWEMPGGRPYSWYPAGSRPNYAVYWR